MWIDTTFDVERMTPLRVGFMSDDYFALISARPEWGIYLSVGDRVLVVLDGQAYQVVALEEGEPIEVPTPASTTPVAGATPKVPPTSTVPVTPPVRNPVATTTPSNRPSGVCGMAVGGILLSLVAAVLFSRRR
jgi:hypothetical protein